MNEQSANTEDTKKRRSIADPGNALILIYIACVVFFLLLGSLSQAQGSSTIGVSLKSNLPSVDGVAKSSIFPAQNTALCTSRALEVCAYLL